jgi:hypothetical protein
LRPSAYRALPRQRDPWLRRLGAVSLATVVTIFLVGFTAEYLAFGG